MRLAGAALVCMYLLHCQIGCMYLLYGCMCLCVCARAKG